MKKEGRDDIQEQFLRQRRNLMVSCAVLALGVYVRGLYVSKPVNFFGTPIDFGGQRINLMVPMLVLVLYWLYRYYLYFQDKGPKGFIALYNERLSLNLRRHAQEFLAENPEFRQSLRDGGVPEDAELTVTASDATILVFSWGRGIRFRVVVAWRAAATHGHGTIEVGQIDHAITYHHDYRVLGSCQFRAAAYVALNTRLFTEYILPFVIAAAALLYAAVKWP